MNLSGILDDRDLAGSGFDAGAGLRSLIATGACWSAAPFLVLITKNSFSQPTYGNRAPEKGREFVASVACARLETVRCATTKTLLS